MSGTTPVTPPRPGTHGLFLSDSEKRSLEDSFAQWKTPLAMRTSVEAVMDSIGDKTFFYQPGLAFLRDAWIAAVFGAAREAGKVRLVSDPWPDFELCIDGKTELFEAVEADDPDRQRGNDYRNKASEVGEGDVEDWVARAEQACSWLRRVCEKKKRKRYGGDVNFVIYLNLNEYGIRQQEVEACFAPATEIVKDNFVSIWVLWKMRAYPVWT